MNDTPNSTGLSDEMGKKIAIGYDLFDDEDGLPDPEHPDAPPQSGMPRN